MVHDPAPLGDKAAPSLNLITGNRAHVHHAIRPAEGLTLNALKQKEPQPFEAPTLPTLLDLVEGQ
jgi:hypothetical protein